jgi:hypothetical protein
MWLFSSPCKRPCEILASVVCLYQCTCILLPVRLSCIGFHSKAQFPLKQIIWNLYTRSWTMKDRTRLILDFNLLKNHKRNNNQIQTWLCIMANFIKINFKWFPYWELKLLNRSLRNVYFSGKSRGVTPKCVKV